ncbi:Crp/Fnr family transcriptional regulator [Pseudotabrizicola sediminis]|uniref:Crp/Fnr family transcriptional regulator n=1 Tax=Pseudotabrizicola sediminis TaxID=2486418 RepID=A0ABY2KKU8_9RHOB|nr:Crp/Fnr family transcriptional regulator [Pseudotabrizicola sediminis]TGD41541.1 Crp/Fnr family transcriptional regulator [Pseudotabrizicola sediminis]
MSPRPDKFIISYVGQTIRYVLIAGADACRGRHRGTVVALVRSGGSWGDNMEQRPKEPRKVTDRNPIWADSLTYIKTRVTQCGLPLGKTSVCGDARHREDREPDSEIVSGGARSHDVWLIRSGILRLQRHAYDGRRQILTLFFPGEIIGFEGEFHEGASIEAATQSGLCRINRHWFDRMVDQDNDLRADLFRQKQDQLDRLHWLTWSLGALSPEERLCAFLALSSKFLPYQPLPDGTGVLAVRLARKDIADLLGTTLELISRIVHKLADAGIIEIRDPAHFRFLDLPRLIAMGKIDGHFDRMAIGIARRRGQFESLVGVGSEKSVCFCGRGQGTLTAINDPQVRFDNLSLNRNLPSGGIGK